MLISLLHRTDVVSFWRKQGYCEVRQGTKASGSRGSKGSRASRQGSSATVTLLPEHLELLRDPFGGSMAVVKQL